MFTGIVQAIGTLKAMTKKGRGFEIIMEVGEDFDLKNKVELGDHNGVCLTVTKISGNCYYADISAETVACTCFKNYKLGQKVNLELACTPSTHLGGHIMQGHVDGVGLVTQKSKLDEAYNIWIKAPASLSRYIAMKGSIAVNGVSLTVNEVVNDTFRLTLIPHTQSKVNFDDFEEGREVNIEVDVLARYLERLLEGKDESKKSNFNSTLLKNGFI